MGREPSEGAESHGGYTVTGIGEADASEVFYDALTNKLSGSATLSDFRNAALQSCVDTGASSLLSCFEAVKSVGLWSTDVNTWTLPSGSSGVDLATYRVPEFFGSSTRFVYYSGSGDRGVYYRMRSCPVSSGSCSWSVQYSAGEPDAIGRPAAATIPGGASLFCFRVQYGSYNNLWCDNWYGSTGPHIGPDPGASDIATSPTLAYFNGYLYIAYGVASGQIHFKRLDPLTMTWSTAQTIHPSASTWLAPVLASGDEDRFGGAGDSLFIVYVIGTGPSMSQIAYVPFDDATGSWDYAAGGVLEQETLTPIGPLTQYYMTNRTPGAAFFRGRLHVVATDVGLDVLGGGNTLWYGSCGMPCDDPADWTRLVRQDGGARPGASIDTYGDYDYSLRIWHRLASSNMNAHRLKESE